ncbi:MAG TPA: histidine phosphatase family protein [Oscillospiraceae bacterium]|nr:histidine phosphatase family protein [Oscillospiraceae bacterium]HPS35583.1 histidine phosphatase family protein [Oscillospiraceae bacterium]
MPYKIYLIRHANATTEPIILGSTDRPLTPKGEQQAAECGKLLKAYPVDAVFSSPLKRAFQTAKAAYPDKTPIIIDGLREYGFGDLEEKPYAQYFNDDRTFDLDRMLAIAFDKHNAEKQKDFLDRIFAAFSKIIESCMKTGVCTIAVFSHGGTISTLMAAFSYPKYESLSCWLPDNCSGYVLKTDPALWMRDRIVENIGHIEYGRIECD